MGRLAGQRSLLQLHRQDHSSLSQQNFEFFQLDQKTFPQVDLLGAQKRVEVVLWEVGKELYIAWVAEQVAVLAFGTNPQ